MSSLTNLFVETVRGYNYILHNSWDLVDRFIEHAETPGGREQQFDKPWNAPLEKYKKIWSDWI
jgi:hypothetical protein